MGTSNWQQIPFCIEALRDISPYRVLDIGVGFGRWGILVREFCDEWRHRHHRENWLVHIEGIEIFPKNVEDYHLIFYNAIHIGDAAEILAEMNQIWDVIIFGDVLEHWPRNIAEQVLSRANKLADYILINIPLGPGWERMSMYGNPYEEHKSFWNLDELLAMKPLRHAVFKEYKGRDYGAFLLSRTNPRRLS